MIIWQLGQEKWNNIICTYFRPELLIWVPGLKYFLFFIMSNIYVNFGFCIMYEKITRFAPWKIGEYLY